jgi:CRP-like cAMP-binding protein
MLPRVKDITIFAGMEEAALDLLLGRAQDLELSAGAIILREGEMGNRFFVITAGAVRVCKRFGQPDEVELAQLQASEFIGEMCILETLPRSATVQALGPVSLLQFPAMAFHDLYKAMPAQFGILLLNMARDLSRRLRRLDEVYAACH